MSNTFTQHLHACGIILLYLLLYIILLSYFVVFLFKCCAQPCSPLVEKSCTAIAKNSGLYGTNGSNEGRVQCKIITVQYKQ